MRRPSPSILSRLGAQGMGREMVHRNPIYTKLLQVRERFSMPPHISEQAEHTGQEIQRQIDQRIEPFDEAGFHWLRRFLSALETPYAPPSSSRRSAALASTVTPTGSMSSAMLNTGL